MGFLKGLALSLLGFLLLLSLSFLGLALTLNQTILNPAFVVSELNKLDVSLLAKDLLEGQIPQGEEYVAHVIDSTIADLEPWIKEQAGVVIHSGYDYLLGKSQSFSVVIYTGPLKDSLKDNLRQAILESPPPELAGLPPATVEQYIDEYYQQISREIPSNFEFSESSLGPEVMVQLEQIRQGIGYFQLGYQTLIGFTLLLILGIILINRQVRSATRSLGTTFLVCGALELLGIFAASILTETQLARLDMPVSLQVWVPQFIDDFLTPLKIFSLCAAVAGAALIVVSFVYKPREPDYWS